MAEASEDEVSQDPRRVLDYLPLADPAVRRLKTQWMLMYVAHMAIGMIGLGAMFIVGLLRWCGYRIDRTGWVQVGCGAALLVLSLRLGLAVDQLKRKIAEISLRNPRRQ